MCGCGTTYGHRVVEFSDLMSRFSKLLFTSGLLVVVACGHRPPRQPRTRPLPPPTPTASSTSPQPEEVKSTTPADPSPQMSESERKASARALYAEGVQLQERADCQHALPRFESAERLYDAPTHLLHI